MKVTRPSLFTYAFLAVPLAFGSLPLYLYMPDFYAREFGLSLGTLGLGLMAVRLLDAVQDPLFGWWAKQIQHDRKRLRRVLAVALALFGAALAAMMAPQGDRPLLWFLLTMTLATMALGLVTILYLSLGALWGQDERDRTAITATREGFALIGILVASALPAALQPFIGVNGSFLAYAGVFLLLLAIAMKLGAGWLAALPLLRPEPPVDAPSFRSLLWRMKGLFLVWFLSLLASAIPAVLVLFFIRDRLQLADQGGWFLGLYFLSGALGMPLWRRMEQRYGKKAAWQAAMLLAILSFGWAFTLQPGDFWPYAAICLLSGLALGAEMAIPPALLADRLAGEGAWHHTGLCFGLAVFLHKAALAAASGLLLPWLAGHGYAPGGANSGDALFRLAAAYALLPCLIKSLALALLGFSRVTRKDVSR